MFTYMLLQDNSLGNILGPTLLPAAVICVLLGGKYGQHSHWMLELVSSILGQNIHRVAQTESPTSTSM